jgi:hypothetical protein
MMVLRAKDRQLADRAAHARRIVDHHRRRAPRGRRCACDLCLRALVTLTELKLADGVDLSHEPEGTRFEVLYRAIRSTFENLGYDDETTARALAAYVRAYRSAFKTKRGTRR